MTDAMMFALGALALLATPGPTNTLLAISGATSGVRASLPLLLAEAAGYLVAIVVLRVLVGPVVAGHPLLGSILSGGVCLYVVWLSVELWRKGAEPRDAEAPVTLGGVFLTTLLNPKAVVFAFTLLPAMPNHLLAPWLAALTGWIVLAGSSWIALGAALKQGTGMSRQIVSRACAVALFTLATIIGSRAAGLE
jgi:threonine/homoserine/homoserine lactone efflux protein